MWASAFILAGPVNGCQDGFAGVIGLATGAGTGVGVGGFGSGAGV